MDNNLIKSKASSLRKEYWGTFILSNILATVVAGIPLIGFVAAPPVALGAYENYYNAYKGKSTGWRKLYGKFDKQFESSFLYSVLFLIAEAIIVIALIIAGILISLIIPVIGIIIALVLVIFVAIVMTGMQCIGFELLLIDPEMKGNTAFSKALEFIKEQPMRYVSLLFSYIGSILLTIITFGIYGIKSIPEIYMAFVILTDEIINGNSVNAQVETRPDEDQAAANAAAGIVCPECGTKNEPDAVFCEKCGNKLA